MLWFYDVSAKTFSIECSFLFGQLSIRLQSFCNSISFSRNLEQQNLMLQYFQAQSGDEQKDEVGNPAFTIFALPSPTAIGKFNRPSSSQGRQDA